MTTLYDRLLPQAKELLELDRNVFPATTEMILEYLKDDQYVSWYNLPYEVVSHVSDRIFGGLGVVEADELNLLFEEHYD